MRPGPRRMRSVRRPRDWRNSFRLKRKKQSRNRKKRPPNRATGRVMPKEKSLNKYLDELKDCAIAVGEKVIHISLKSSGDVIKRMILAETEKLKKTAWVKIYMERTDYETMMKGDADMISELSRLSDNVKFVVMNKDKSGRCIIEMPDQVVDVSVDTQLENIREVLENVR